MRLSAAPRWSGGHHPVGDATSGPVLHPAARRKLLDEKPLSADRRAHRGVRVAPDATEGPTGGPGPFGKGGGRTGGGAEYGRRTAETRAKWAADGTAAARMTSVTVR